MQTRLLWDYLEQTVVARVGDNLGGHSAAGHGVSLDVAGALNVDAGDDAFVQSPCNALGCPNGNAFSIRHGIELIHGGILGPEEAGKDDAHGLAIDRGVRLELDTVDAGDDLVSNGLVGSCRKKESALDELHPSSWTGQ